MRERDEMMKSQKVIKRYCARKGAKPRKTLRAHTIENPARNSLVLNDLIHAGGGT